MCLFNVFNKPVTTKKNLFIEMNDFASARLQVNKWAFLIFILEKENQQTITSATFRIPKDAADF